MTKIIYLKKDTKGKFVEFPEPLNPEQFNNIGTTWQDYEDNLWVRLSDEQVAFYEEHPKATVKEVWNMELTPVPAITLEQAKAEKITEIEQYNDSDNVNEFSVVKDGVTVTDWLTPEKRSNYKNSIDAANLVGLDSLSLYVGGMPVTLPTQTAELVLAQIQLYADQCFIVTERHKAAVDALETIEAVDAYDYETGYPEKLRFEVPLANAEEVVAEEQE